MLSRSKAAFVPRRTRLWRWLASIAVVVVFSAAFDAAVGRAADADPIVLQSLWSGDSQVILDWTGGVPPYRVQACTDNRFLWRDISDFIFGTRYTGPTRGDVVLFRVRSASDTIAPSSPASAAIVATRCDAIALDWPPAEDDADGSGVQSYRIYRDGVPVTDVAHPDTFFLDHDVQPETTYVYTVTALDFLNNESLPTVALPATTPACVGESGPLTELTIAWDANEERSAVGYLIYWGLRPGDYLWVMDVMDSTSARIADLVPGSAYFFSVTTYDRDGVQSDPSAEVGYILPAN